MGVYYRCCCLFAFHGILRRRAVPQRASHRNVSERSNIMDYVVSSWTRNILPILLYTTRQSSLLAHGFIFLLIGTLKFSLVTMQHVLRRTLVFPRFSWGTNPNCQCGYASSPARRTSSATSSPPLPPFIAVKQIGRRSTDVNARNGAGSSPSKGVVKLRSRIFAEDIIFEDNHVLVVNKQPGWPVQADVTNDPNMLDMLKDYVSFKYNKPGDVYMGLVHRLDRPCSGLMVFAKTSKAATRLSLQFRNRTVHKVYVCVVNGRLERNSTAGCDSISGTSPSGTTTELIHQLRNDASKSNRVYVMRPESESSMFGLEGGKRRKQKRHSSSSSSSSVSNNINNDGLSILEYEPLCTWTYSGGAPPSILTATLVPGDSDSHTVINTNGSTAVIHAAAAATATTADNNNNNNNNNNKIKTATSADSKAQTATSADSRAQTATSADSRAQTQTLVKVILKTGRKHQIRAQLAAIGHPICGDTKYGAPQRFNTYKDIALHALSLSFEHPTMKNRLSFSALPPRPLLEEWQRRFGDKAMSSLRSLQTAEERAGKVREKSESLDVNMGRR